MTSESTSVFERVAAYAEQSAIKLEEVLGAGYDGTVFSTDRLSAVKALKFQELYQRERDIYLRLQERQVQLIAGCQIPQLISFDDSLWMIEMTMYRHPTFLTSRAPTWTIGQSTRPTFAANGSERSELSLDPIGNTYPESSLRSSGWGSTWQTRSAEYLP